MAFHDLGAHQVAELTERAIQQGLANGMLMVCGKTGELKHAPFILLPSPVPRHCFEQAERLTPLFNLLVDRVSRNVPYLLKVLSHAAKVDDFVRRKLDILQTIAREEEELGHPIQPISLSLHRHDFMIHEPSLASSTSSSSTSSSSTSSTSSTSTSTAQLQQVEMNTISAAFSSLGTTVSDLHRFICEVDPIVKERVVPGALKENHSDIGHADLLGAAHQRYGKAQAVVLIVVLPGEKNLFDQRRLEFLLWARHGVRCIRRTLRQVQESCYVEEEGRALLAREEGAEPVEVAIVYFRAAYMPEHYPSEAEWQARLLMERSKAIKCPNIGVHLAGCKKVQQDLAAPGVLESFFAAPEEQGWVAELRSCFAGLYSLDPDAATTREVIDRCLAAPGDFVLKPQREGGGNNLYQQALKDKLLTASPEELSAFIVMTRIVPRPYPMMLVREGLVAHLDGVSELGIFGGFLGTRDEIFVNRATGFLLRSKSAQQDDGGVAAGVAYLDSPYLI